MANRSLWPEGCEVHQKHLEYDTSERIASIRLRTGHMSEYGVSWGLQVTPNQSVGTQIDIAAGGGYTQSGEYVEISAVSAKKLSDYTSGAKNYVVVFYDEEQTMPEPHETNGSIKNTRASMRARLSIMTESQYASMASTSQVLTVDAKDRALLVAVVTAAGPSVSIDQSRIQSPTVFGQAKYVSILGTNGTVHAQPVNITGVTVISVSGDTEEGDDGKLAFEASTKSISWKAPGESVGSAVQLLNSDAVTLTSGGKELKIDVAFTRLPIINAEDTIRVSNLYSQDVPRFSTIDHQHRSLVGGGQPTRNNPHGMTMDDLAPGVAGSLEQHQDVMHSNGIAPGSSLSLFECSLYRSGSADDSVTFNVNFQLGDAAYVNGRRIEYFAANASSTINFADDTNTKPSLYGFYLSQDKHIFKHKRLQHSDINLIDRLFVTNTSQNLQGGTYSILWTTDDKLSFDGGLPIDVGAPSMSNQPRYVRLVGQDCVSYIDVYIKVGALSGSNITANIEVFDEPDLSLCLPLAYVNYSGRGGQSPHIDDVVGYEFGTLPMFYDRRTYGTLMPDNFNTLSGYESARALVVDTFAVDSFLALPSSYDYVEYTSNGATNTSNYDDYWFNLRSAASLDVTFNGGIAYIGGKRHLVATKTLTLQANAYNYVYIKHNGEFAFVSGSNPTLFDLELNKLAYLGEPELGVALVVTGASTLQATIDLRPYSYKRIKNDVRFGQVGLDGFNRATIQSTSATGSALTVKASGAGYAITAVGSASSNNPVVYVDANGSDQVGIFASGAGSAIAAVSGASEGTGAGLYGVGGPTGSPTVNSITSYKLGAGAVGVGSTNSGYGIVGIGDAGTSVSTIELLPPATPALSTGVVGVGSGAGHGVFGVAGNTSDSGVYGYGGSSPGGYGVKGVGSPTSTASVPSHGVFGLGRDYAFGVYGYGGGGIAGGGGVIGRGGTGSLGTGSDGVHGYGGGTTGSGGVFRSAGSHSSGSYAVVADSSSGAPIKLVDPGYSLCQASGPMNTAGANVLSSANLINNWVTFRFYWVNDPNDSNNVIGNQFEVKSGRNFSAIQVYNNGDWNANLRIVWTKRLSSLWLPVICSAWIEAEKGQTNAWLPGGGDKPWPVWQYRYQANTTAQDPADDPQPNFTRIQIADNPGSLNNLNNYLDGSCKFMITISVMVIGPVVD